jgi:hypothetical protein
MRLINPENGEFTVFYDPPLDDVPRRFQPREGDPLAYPRAKSW